MLFPPNITHSVAQCAYCADRIIRSELSRGYIATENDYTSNLTCTFRREINARAITGLNATSYVLMPSVERAVGADACIILKNDRQFKVCLFEAKWPRLKTNKDYWDSLQQSSNVSHFHDQLLRQAAISPAVAVWEMFYCEYEFSRQPRHFPSHVSACVWHKNALDMSLSRGSANVPWTDFELENLLLSHGKNIYRMIMEVCYCKKGEAFDGDDYRQAFKQYRIPREILVVEYSTQPAKVIDTGA